MRMTGGMEETGLVSVSIVIIIMRIIDESAIFFAIIATNEAYWISFRHFYNTMTMKSMPTS